MSVFGFIWAIIECFFKFIGFLLGLTIAIPLLFILSVIVAVITGAILLGVFYIGVKCYEYIKDEKKEKKEEPKTE